MPRNTRDRSDERLLHHYQVEVELAERLRTAPAAERGRLYGEAYNELFQRVPDHPQLAKITDPSIRKQKVDQKLKLVERYITPSSRFLEIGCGDGAFANAMVPIVAEVVAVDVSEEIATSGGLDQHVRLVLSDGVNIPVTSGSIDVAFSDQLMEHLHPDDARDQLMNVAEALAPNGWYICCTPNRFSGPHDVSQYFDDVARGFHLHEYTLRELRPLLEGAGFVEVRVFMGGRGQYVRVPALLGVCVEWLLERLPTKWRRRSARLLPVRAVLGINVAARR